MNSEICRAISQKSIVKFMYHGEVREVEPHCHGMSKKGNEGLRAFQIGGGSVSGNPSPWRLFNVNEISDFEITDQIFEGPRPDYNPEDKGMVRICCGL